jgi:hypothetical protein
MGRLEDMLEANRIILDTLMPAPRGQPQSEILGKVVGGRRPHRAEHGAGPRHHRPRCRHRERLYRTVHPDRRRRTVRGSEVEHSIPLRGFQHLRRGGRIESSLIGRNVSICRTASKPRSFNFMLGDRSEVGLI